MRVSKEEQEDILKISPLVNVFLKDRKRMGTDSPYTWYLLDESEISLSIDLLGRSIPESKLIIKTKSPN